MNVSFYFPRCKGLVLLETYTALEDDSVKGKLPPILNIDCEVTGNPDYSMFNLSLVEDWNTSDKYCNAFKGETVGKRDGINGSVYERL